MNSKNGRAWQWAIGEMDETKTKAAELAAQAAALDETFGPRIGSSTEDGKSVFYVYRRSPLAVDADPEVDHLAGAVDELVAWCRSMGSPVELLARGFYPQEGRQDGHIFTWVLQADSRWARDRARRKWGEIWRGVRRLDNLNERLRLQHTDMTQ